MARESELAEKAASADGLPDPHDVVATDEEIPVRELFDEAFVRAHSRFECFDEMVAASPAAADSADDLTLVAEGEWDDFVAEHTDFADEEEMVFAAIDDWVTGTLGL
jgi:hypothetical protein